MEHTDLADLRRKVMGARTVVHELAPGVSVSFTLPTQHEIDVELMAARRPKDPDAKASLQRMKRALLVRGITAWTGVMVSHLVPDHEPDEPLDCEPEAMELLFVVKEDWAEALETRLMLGMAERRKAREESEKNSPSS